MIEHTNTIGSRNTGPAAASSSSSSVVVAVPPTLHHPRHPPLKAHAPLSTIPNNNNSSSSYDLRRRAAQRIVVKLFTREFDPLWAYVMSETQYYNEVVMKLTNEANELMKAGSNLCQHLINHHRGLCDNIHSIRHVMSVINTLQNGFTPKQWLQRSSSASISGFIGDSSVYGCNNASSSSSDHSLSRLKLEDWIQQLTERRNFLYDWLSVGNPGMIKLHLLQNPEGLFYALRETYAMRKSIISIDMVICKYQLFDMEKISTTNHNHRDDMTILSKSNFGCNVMIGDAVLYNGSYDEKGEALEFLPDHSALNVGKKYMIHISAALNEQEISQGDGYHCPLYVDNDLPQSIDIMYDSNSSRDRSIAPLLHVPMHTVEDREDCKMRGVALFSGPKWTTPI